MRTLVTDNCVGIAATTSKSCLSQLSSLALSNGQLTSPDSGLLLNGLMEAVGPTIAVSSTPGVGTTFAIELAGVLAPHVKHEHQILYVEHNISNLKLVERVLQRHAPIEMIPAMQAHSGSHRELVLARLKGRPGNPRHPRGRADRGREQGASQRAWPNPAPASFSQSRSPWRACNCGAAFIDNAARGDASCAD